MIIATESKHLRGTTGNRLNENGKFEGQKKFPKTSFFLIVIYGSSLLEV